MVRKNEVLEKARELKEMAEGVTDSRAMYDFMEFFVAVKVFGRYGFLSEETVESVKNEFKVFYAKCYNTLYDSSGYED